MIDKLKPALLEKHISRRAAHRSLTVNLTKMRYVQTSLFSMVPEDNRKRALYVGVGHGHDATLALLSEMVEEVIGVDPFIETDGNGDEDYRALLELIDELELNNSFTVERKTIQDYLATCNKTFDLIIVSDALHHIFVTTDLLSHSELFADAVSLFSDLYRVSNKSGMMVISEVEKYGLRPWLNRTGVLKGNIDFSTKQPSCEWKKAAEKASWKLCNVRNYIPYQLRFFTFLGSGFLSRHTFCNGVILYFSAVKL